MTRNPARPEMLEIGQRIRQARKAADLTQAELGSRVGLSRSSIANIENGRQEVSVALVKRISLWCHVSVASLVDESDSVHDEELRKEGRAQAAQILGLRRDSTMWFLMVRGV